MTTQTRYSRSGSTPFRDMLRALPRAAWWIVSICLAILFLYPLYIMFTQVFKSPVEANAIPPTLIPHSFYLGNFTHLTASDTGVNLLTSIGNTLFVAVTTTVIAAVLSTLAGYAFAKLPFPGGRALFFVILVTFMIPFQAIITPLFLTLKNLGLQDSLFGLCLVIATFNLPFGIFLMRNAFSSIPAALEEAALIDGCNLVQALWRVMLPLAIPGLVSTALLTFFAAWNEFFATIILISDQSKYTLPVSLAILSSGENGSINWGLLQTGALITVVPCVILYLTLQKYYVSGLLGGSVK